MAILSTPGFDDPLALLDACHRRVERFLGVLRQVAAQPEGPLSAEAEEALRQALRYFAEAGPRHTADEEESLLPRLLALEHPGVEALWPRVEALQAEHRVAEALHAEVDALAVAWLAGATDRARFAAVVDGLVELYGPHIAFEDQDLFPLARRVLSGEEQEAVGREMKARRTPKRESG